jgi:hypothetical protein
MKWLAPLIILAILVIFGAWFCSKHEEPAPPKKPPVANTNANANTGNKANTETAGNTNTTANANTNMAANSNAPANANAAPQ